MVDPIKYPLRVERQSHEKERNALGDGYVFDGLFWEHGGFAVVDSERKIICKTATYVMAQQISNDMNKPREIIFGKI
jgi:hypothetical protein